MMGYQLFKDVIVNRIIEMLPPLFWNHEPQIHTVRKVNQEKEALIVVPKDKNGLVSASPAFYLEDLYEEFRESQDMDEIMEKIAEDVIRYSGSFPCGDFAEDISARKDQIIMSLVNTEKNRGLLENIPHEEVLDMSVIYRVVMNEDESGIASIILTNDLMQSAGIAREELGPLAYENTRRMFPAEIIELSENFHIMTNSRKAYGAVTILYRDSMKELSEHVGGDFYIIPSSIHEIIAVSDTDNDLKYLIRCLAEGNSGFIEEKELLSNTIYHYDAEKDNIRMAASYFNSDMLA